MSGGKLYNSCTLTNGIFLSRSLTSQNCISRINIFSEFSTGRISFCVLEGELLQRGEKDEKEKYFHIVEHSSHLVFGFTDNKLCFSVVL